MLEEFKRYWPFEVMPLEKQTKQHKREICFLERAYQQGYRAYTYGAGDYGVIGQNGQYGNIIVRSRDRRWEVVLGVEETQVASIFLDQFECAADAVLGWLRGEEPMKIISQVHDHLVVMPGAKKSYYLDKDLPQ